MNAVFEKSSAVANNKSGRLFPVAVVHYTMMPASYKWNGTMSSSAVTVYVRGRTQRASTVLVQWQRRDENVKYSRDIDIVIYGRKSDRFKVIRNRSALCFLKVVQRKIYGSRHLWQQELRVDASRRKEKG
ncbi:hypothetical protein CBL_07505 [Carabus blaptoides fortunei]